MLLIVLSVIIVGTAMAAGMAVFNDQAYSTNKSALADDAQYFAAHILQHFKAPKAHGGMGGMVAGMEAADIGRALSWENETGKTDHGTYTISFVDGDTTKVRITGRGATKRRGKVPQVITEVSLYTSIIKAEVSDVSP